MYSLIRPAKPQPSLWDRIAGDESLPLGVRLFRLLSVAIAIVALALAEPGNLFQAYPWPVHVATLAIGVVSGACYLISRRGYHLQGTYIVASLLTLNTAWFGNGGSHSGLPLFLFPLLCMSLVIFTGWRRVLFATLVGLNTYLLLFLEWQHPGWLSTYATPTDRLVELSFSAASCGLITVASIGLLVYSHGRERARSAEFTRELQASERYGRMLFDATSEAILIHDGEGRVLNVNKRMCELFHLDEQKALQSTIADLSAGGAPFTLEVAKRFWARTKTLGTQYGEWQTRRPDGSRFWVEVGLNTCELGGETIYIAALRDITERKQREESLRLLEERQRQSFEASLQGWFEIDVVTGEACVSPEYLRLIGYDPATYHATRTSWREGIHPEDRGAVEQIYNECVTTGESRVFEYRRRTAGGGWKWIRSAARIVERDAQGKPLRMRGTHADVTEWKKLEAQLQHAHRLESIGSLTSGIAHELNNAMTPLLLTSGLIEAKLTAPEDREILRLWETAVQRSARIVQQLLAFSQRTEIRRTPLATAQFIQEFSSIIGKSLPPRIKLATELPAELWGLNADPTQLQQVMMNLCLNAQEAMPDGGTLTLAAGNVPALAAPAPHPHHAPASRGAYVRLQIRDTGRGIDPKIHDRIFDPFFTTKEVGKGMGLGLSMVHGIIESHGGFVAVESEPGKGSSFSVYLPARLIPSAGPVPPPAPTPAAVPEKPTLLLVDDDAAILFTTRLLLERQGYHILPAGDGAEALRIFGEHRGEIQLVITDLVMPVLSGPELAERLRALDPTLRILGVSGNAHGDHSRDFLEVLPKPYELATLQAAVQRHLGPRTEPR